MRGAQLKNRSWLLYLIIIFLYSCEDNDDKISANLPELKKTFISISGSTGLYDAVTFNIGGTEYIGLGWNNIMGDNLHFSKYSYMIPLLAIGKNFRFSFPVKLVVVRLLSR